MILVSLDLIFRGITQRRTIERLIEEAVLAGHGAGAVELMLALCDGVRGEFLSTHVTPTTTVAIAATRYRNSNNINVGCDGNSIHMDSHEGSMSRVGRSTTVNQLHARLL